MKQFKRRRSRRDGNHVLDEALAVLISSTYSKKRPLSLLEIANWLKVAKDKLGSYSEVSRRIGLSSKMLRQFSYVRRLTPPVQRLFRSRRLNSVDAATHLAMLRKGDQLKVAQALAAREIDTGDVRAVIQLRKNGVAGDVDRLVERVKASRTKQENVVEFVVRGKATHHQVRRAFERYVPPTEIIRCDLDGSLGRIIVTQKGKQALSRAAGSLGVPLKHVVSRILRGND